MRTVALFLCLALPASAAPVPTHLMGGFPPAPRVGLVYRYADDRGSEYTVRIKAAVTSTEGGVTTLCGWVVDFHHVQSGSSYQTYYASDLQVRREIRSAWDRGWRGR